MPEPIKVRLVRNIMSIVRERKGDPTMDRTRCETALRNMGMKPGNAQRLLDETTDVQVTRLAEVASMLGVPAASLLADRDALAVAEESTVDSSLAVLLDAVSAIPPARWVSVRAQLDQVAGRPEMRDDVLAELRMLLAPSPTKDRQAA